MDYILTNWYKCMDYILTNWYKCLTWKFLFISLGIGASVDWGTMPLNPPEIRAFGARFTTPSCAYLKRPCTASLRIGPQPDKLHVGLLELNAKSW